MCAECSASSSPASATSTRSPRSWPAMWNASGDFFTPCWMPACISHRRLSKRDFSRRRTRLRTSTPPWPRRKEYFPGCTPPSAAHAKYSDRLLVRTFAWFLGLILLGLASIAVFAYPAWLLLHPHFEFPFHRIGERIGMLALCLGFLLTARRLGLRDRTSLGYGLTRPKFLREASIGLALGVASMSAVVGLMTALGLLDWSEAAGFTAAALAKLVVLRLLSGLAVAFIEETFLRGAMHTGIERESGSRAAVILTAIVYSATHFFASFRIPAAEVSAW